MAVIGSDTSFLFSLYGNDVSTSRAIRAVEDLELPVSLSPFNEFELGNALRFAEFRKLFQPGEASVCLADFRDDIATGKLLRAVCNLADVLAEANRLSAHHTLKAGHRSMDIIHVAAALHLRADRFLTFDSNQRKLAEAEGLTVPL